MEDAKWQEIVEAEREAMRLHLEYEMARLALARMMQEYKESREGL